MAHRSAKALSGNDYATGLKVQKLGWLAVLLVLLVLPACEPSFTGAAQVDYQRSQYGVELTSFHDSRFHRACSRTKHGRRRG